MLDSEKQYKWDFASRDLNDLLDAWEVSMPEPIRKILLREFEARHYRTKSLPTPPPAVETTSLDSEPVKTPELSSASASRAFVADVQAAEWSTEVDKALVGPHANPSRAAANWVLALGILHILVGLWFGYDSVAENQAPLEMVAGMGDNEIVQFEGEDFTAFEVRLIAYISMGFAFGVPIGLGLVFLLLYWWARKSPLPALITALGLYVAAIAANAIFDPSSLYHGLVFKILFFCGIIAGIRAELESSREKQVRESA